MRLTEQDLPREFLRVVEEGAIAAEKTIGLETGSSPTKQPCAPPIRSYSRVGVQDRSWRSAKGVQHCGADPWKMRREDENNL